MADGNFMQVPPLEGTSKKERKRKLILHCAAIMFNTRGSRGTTLLDITAQLGLTKTSLYYYVKNKDDLVYQCYKESCKEYTALIENAAKYQDGSFLARLFTDYMDFWASILERKRPAIAVLSEILAMKDPHKSEITQQYVSLVLRIRDVLERDMAAGVIRRQETLATAHAFISTMQWIPAWLRRERLIHLDQFKQAAFDILMNGICNRPNLLSDISYKTAEAKEGPLFNRRMSKDEKLNAFLQEATKQFNTKGFNGASIDEIAEKLQVTKGAFYYHFTDKQMLAELCIRRGIKLGHAAVKFAEQNAEDGLDRFCFALGFMFIIENSNEGPFASLGLLYALDDDKREKLIQEINVLSSKMGEFLEDGKADGSIRQVNRFIAQSILTGVILSGDNFGVWRQIDDMKEAARTYLEGLLSGMSPSGKPATKTKSAVKAR